MHLAIYALLSGLLFGFFYAFLASGLNLVFGVLRLVNLAHGDVVVFGAYVAYTLSTQGGVNPLVAIPAVLVPAGLLGVALYKGAVPRLTRSDDPETASLIFFFGVSQVLEAIAVFAYGNNQVSLRSGTFGGPVAILGEKIPAEYVVGGLISLPALVLLFAYLYRSRLGLATRAVMVSSEEALASGINTSRVAAYALGIGLAFAAASGALTLFMLGGVEPSSGSAIVLTAFTVVVIGSLGNPVGTIVGGILYGLVFSFVSTYQPSWADLVPYGLMLIVLLTRPTGLLGRRMRSV